jgi:phosphohistidine phosphatase
MELLIVRHAIAFNRNPRRWPDDTQRPLSPKGIERARKAAAGLKRAVSRPGRVLTSPLVRARQTAAILTEYAGWPEPLEIPALAPGKAPEAVIEALRENSAAVIAVVGHQPGLGQLLAACLDAGRTDARHFELRKFGVASLSFNGTPQAGRAVLSWLVRPKILRAIR